MNLDTHLPSFTRAVAQRLASSSPSEICECRANCLKGWIGIAKSLDAQEKQLKAGLDPHVGRVLASKRLLLYQKALLDAGFSDVGAAGELLEGTRLVGSVPMTHRHPQLLRPASLTVDQLRKSAPGIRVENCAVVWGC